MELASYLPKRVFIRYRAKAQLQADAIGFSGTASSGTAFSETASSGGTATCLDEALIREISGTLFQSELYRSLYSQCRSQREAAGITDRMINDLVNSYRRIKQQQQNPLIQQLNSLL